MPEVGRPASTFDVIRDRPGTRSRLPSLAGAHPVRRIPVVGGRSRGFVEGHRVAEDLELADEVVAGRLNAAGDVNWPMGAWGCATFLDARQLRVLMPPSSRGGAAGYQDQSLEQQRQLPVQFDTHLLHLGYPEASELGARLIDGEPGVSGRILRISVRSGVNSIARGSWPNIISAMTWVAMR
jgi:hypothetical protein